MPSPSPSWLREASSEDLNDLFLICYIAAGDEGLTPFISGRALTWCAQIQAEQERRYAESQKTGQSVS